MLPAWSVPGAVEVGETGASGSPSATPEERLFPSLQPLGIAELFQKITFLRKKFISARADLVVTHGSRVEISWEMCISCFPSVDKTLGETLAPAPAAPAAAGTGPGAAARET